MITNAYMSSTSRLVDAFLMLCELVAFVLFLAGLCAFVLIIG